MSLIKKKIFRISLGALAIFGLIVAWLGFGERGFIHLYRMEKERQAYQERIQQLEQINKDLLDEINRLREDDDYIESIARKELGLVREGEIIYRFSKTPGEEEPIDENIEEKP